MKALWAWLRKYGVAVVIITCFFLVIVGPLVLPITVQLFAIGGEELLFRVRDAAAVIFVVFIAAGILYAVGRVVWQTVVYIRSLMKRDRDH